MLATQRHGVYQLVLDKGICEFNYLHEQYESYESNCAPCCGSIRIRPFRQAHLLSPFAFRFLTSKRPECTLPSDTKDEVRSAREWIQNLG